MEDNNSIEFDFSDGDIEIGVDNTAATVPDGWYICKITSAKATKKFNDKVGQEVINVSVGLAVDEGPFKGAFGSGFLPLDDPRQYAAKIRKSFFRALGVEETEFSMKIGLNEDGTAAELKGVVGERVGAKLETTSRDGRDFLQVPFNSYIPVEEVPDNNGDTDDSGF